MIDHPPRYQMEWSIGRLKVRFERRSSREIWGRFGGGWNWSLGFKAGGSTLILLLLIASLRFHLVPKGDATQKEGGGA